MKLISMLKKHLHLSSRTLIAAETALLGLLCLSFFFSQVGENPVSAPRTAADRTAAGQSDAEKNYIKWVDFDVTSEAMNQAFRYDVDTCLSEPHVNWVDLLAYLGARYGGDFSRYKPAHMDAAAQPLMKGETTIEELTKDMKYYDYYREAYGAVLDGLVGRFQAEIPVSEAPPEYLPSDPSASSDNTASENSASENSAPETIWVTKYGLKGFSPIAKGFPYSDFDDFGTARSYGFKRQHLGHDMMGQVGTPVIAVESGTVEAMGWNQYGGWRLGIRSLDKKRYYYYAHLRKNYPYQSDLKEGSPVQAGDVIGYLGRTGYSSKENTNNIDEPHLHFGIQLIFDESQKEGNNEIWIDCYELSKFLRLNQSLTAKTEGTKEWHRVYKTKEQP